MLTLAEVFCQQFAFQTFARRTCTCNAFVHSQQRHDQKCDAWQCPSTAYRHIYERCSWRALPCESNKHSQKRHQLSRPSLRQHW